MQGSVSLIIDQPLKRVVWRLALPAMAAMLLRYANYAVDQLWIGRLSHASLALAAISASNFLIWVLYSQSNLFSVGLQALVARAVGARDPEAQERAMGHGIALAAVLGLLVGAAGMLCVDAVLRFEALEPAVRVLARQFLAVVFIGLPINYVGIAFDTIYRAEGDTVTPFKVGLLSLVINTALDPLFIRGWGPIPAMGIRGSALVTLACQCVQLVVLVALHRRRMRAARAARPGREHVEGPRFELAEFVRSLKIGFPIAVSSTIFSFVYIVMVRILGPFGSAAVASLGLGHTIEGLPHFMCVGFGTAAATLVGQNLGAERPAAAERAAWRVAWYLVSLLLPVAALYGTFAPTLLGVFMHPLDPKVLYYGTQYLRMAAAVQVFGGFEMVMWQALTGAGETLSPTLLDLVVLWLRIPLAALLAHRLGLGPLGVWLSIGTMSVVGAVAMTWLFRRGTWKSRTL